MLEYRGGWGPDNEEKARHQEVQQQRFDELSKIYDKSHPVGELTVDGQTIRQSSVNLVLFAKRVNCVSLYCSC